MIGNKLGPYELLEEIGRGGMATVYRAFQPNVDRFVAVKVIHRSVASDSKSLDRFTREARLIAKLEHPHILPVYDYNGANDPPYIVMRYLPTGTLKDILERGQLPFHEVAFLMGQIASALDYAHRQGVIHRDIKPSNIMVDSDGNAFLTDFGIARIVEAAGEGLTGTGMAIGTPGYMAPEQGLGVPIDHRADIYALGVMLFEMLTGKVPFSAETPMAVILKHINDPVPQIALVNPKLPPEVNHVVQRAMAKRPEDRYETASEMARALTAALGPADNPEPQQLRKTASQTIAELSAIRQAVQPQPPTALGGSPPSKPPTGKTPAPAASTPFPISTQTQVRGGTMQGALIGAGVVILLAILAGGGFLFISNKNSAEATSSAVAVLNAQQTTTRIFQQAISSNQTANASSLTQTASAQPSPTGGTAVVLTPTLTLTPTKIPPSSTYTATAIPPTLTHTTTAVPPTLTFTPTKVPPTLTHTATAVPPTLTFTPTKVPPTLTHTATAVPPTLTFTPTPLPTLTHTPTVAPTLTFTPAPPIPVTPATGTPVANVPEIPGRLPYINDFEAPDSLANWDLDPNSWRLQADSGNVSLVGTGGQRAPAVVLAHASPEWMDAGAQNLLLSLRMNLDTPASGGRVIFRYTDANGYYVLEMLPGLLAIKRGQGGKGGIDRTSERVMAQVANAPIRNGNWYAVQVWADTSRIFVYLEHNLVLSPEDTGQTLPGGSIILQTLNANFRVRFDDIKVQRPLPASQHFRGSDWPSTWTRTNSSSAKVGTERGTGFIEVDSGDVRPINPPVGDMLMACRLWSPSGAMEVRLRESNAGALLFHFEAGNMSLEQIDNTGKVKPIHGFPNFYGYGRFFDLIVETIGNEVRVYKDADIFAQVLPNMPPPGDTRFIAPRPDDTFRVGDCLFAQTAKSPTEDVRWAFTKIKEVESRPYTPLLMDWYDKFDDKFRTKDWWEGGINAPGEFKTDPKDQNHKNYLEITYQEGAAWRMFRYVKEFYVFGLGQDKATFFDSSDIYLRVNVRLPKAGTAWIAARTSTSLGGGTLNGFHLELTRDNNNDYTITSRGYWTGGQPIFFQGALPVPVDQPGSDWVQLMIVTYQDKVAFFANGRPVGAATSVPVLSGTIAIGVEKDSVADFDDLELRDVSPETR